MRYAESSRQSPRPPERRWIETLGPAVGVWPLELVAESREQRSQKTVTADDKIVLSNSGRRSELLSLFAQTEITTLGKWSDLVDAPRLTVRVAAPPLAVPADAVHNAEDRQVMIDGQPKQLLLLRGREHDLFGASDWTAYIRVALRRLYAEEQCSVEIRGYKLNEPPSAWRRVDASGLYENRTYLEEIP